MAMMLGGYGREYIVYPTSTVRCEGEIIITIFRQNNISYMTDDIIHLSA